MFYQVVLLISIMQSILQKCKLKASIFAKACLIACLAFFAVTSCKTSERQDNSSKSNQAAVVINTVNQDDSLLVQSSSYLKYRDSVDEAIDYIDEEDMEDYDPSRAQTLSQQPEVKKDNLEKDLKVAILTDSSFSATSLKDIKTTINLFLQELGDQKMQIEAVQTNQTSLPQSIASLKADGYSVIISPSAGAFAKSISNIIAKDPAMLFISITNFKNSKDYPNVVSFGYEALDQFEAILDFAKTNDVHNIALLAPNTKLGANIGLVLSKAVADFTRQNNYKISLRNAEFYTNSSSVDLVLQTYDEQQNTQAAPQATPQANDTQASEENLQQALPNTQEEDSRVSSKFYLKKILMSHLKQIEKIDAFISEQQIQAQQALIAPEANLQPQGDQINQISASASNTPEAPKSIAKFKWASTQEAEADKKTILFFTGTAKDKSKIISEFEYFKKMRYYRPSMQNIFVFTDSFMDAYIKDQANNPFKDVFFPYQDYIVSSAFKSYYKTKTGDEATRLSASLHDALSFIYAIFTSKASDGNAFASIKKSLDTAEGLRLKGAEGDYVMLENRIKRSYGVMYFDQNGSLAQVAKQSDEVLQLDKTLGSSALATNNSQDQVKNQSQSQNSYAKQI